MKTFPNMLEPIIKPTLKKANCGPNIFVKPKETKVNKIKIIATLIDEDGKILDTINGKVMSNIIMPGMKGSFDIITNEKKIDGVLGYDLGFEYKLAAPKNQVIEIVSSEIKLFPAIFDKSELIVIS